MRDDAILCSNTSTIPITQLAAGLERPERFCGLHFFNPVRQMPLVEVIRGKKTSDATIATAVAYAKSLGKSPIVMNDGPGFLVNRLLLPYMNEAALLLCEGAEHRRRSSRPPSRSACRWGRSRCTTSSASTWPCTPAARWSRRFPIASCRPPIVQQLVERGRIGQKVGNGFFDYGPAKGGKPPRGTDSAEVAAADRRVPHRRAAQSSRPTS